MSDFNIFLTDEVKQQLREQEEAEKKRLAFANDLYQFRFDGNKLDEYNQRGEKTASWPAMSGNAGYQEARYQDLRNFGPIPEGTYHFKKDAFQDYDKLGSWDKFKSSFNRGTFPGGLEAWGRYRVDLVPGENTDTYGRSGIMIHGGDTFGSAGCIDLEKQIDDFYNRLQRMNQTEFPVTVEYDHNRPFDWARLKK